MTVVYKTIKIRKDMIENKWSNTPQKAKIKKTGEIVSGFTDGHGHFDVFVDVHTFLRYDLSEVVLQQTDIMSKRAEEAAETFHNQALSDANEYARMHGGSIIEEVCYGRGLKAGFIKGYEQAEKETIQRIKELLRIRIVERTERCQEDWSNRQKDRVNMRNGEDGDIILVLEKLEEE